MIDYNSVFPKIGERRRGEQRKEEGKKYGCLLRSVPMGCIKSNLFILVQILIKIMKINDR